MFLNNSYFNVLRKIDKSWEERRQSKNKTSFWKRQFSKSSSASSKSLTSCSSDESGLFSGDINSGYYGDDETDPCPKCLAESPSRGVGPIIDDYDVISIEVNIREKQRYSNLNRKTLESINFDDEFVVIPSSREEFCSGNFRHSTPKQLRDRKESLVTCTPRVVTQVTQQDSRCSCVTPQKPVRFRLYAPRRSSSDSGVWWRENIVWQLKQRNKTQTTNFMQLRDHSSHHVKPKVRINRELADYLNKYAEFRPHNDDLNSAFYEREPNEIDKSEIIQAIRTYGGLDNTTRPRTNSVAFRAKAYIESQKQPKDIRDTDDEDYSTTRTRSRSRPQNRDGRPTIPRWRESITSQLEMRNFLECKYFTDAIVRLKLSQLSISFSHTDSKSVEILTDYDVITDDDVSTVVMNRKSINSSQSISQGYHSSPPCGGNKDPSAFVIRDLDAVYGKVT